MGPLKELAVCVLVLLVGVSQGLLIVGPKSIRPNRDYTLVISNFQSKLNKVDLMVRLMDHQDGVSPLNLTKLVDVRQNSNKMITFHIPASAPEGDYRITVDGQRGFSFHKEHLLEYQGDSVSALLQLNKPVYKPGDTVQFRVIVLDVDLKPPSDVFELNINVRDSSNNNIRKWTQARLYAGVFENEISIAPSPLLGTYKIEVSFHDKMVSKTFEVKEYVLSTFDVDVQPTVVPLLEHQALNLSITASYYFGKPVAGTATLELYFEQDDLDQKKTVQVNGMLPVHLPFNRELDIFDSQSDVTLNVIFKEQYTNRTVSRRYPITVFKNVYNAVLEKAAKDFVPGAPFKCSVRIKFQDGKPARGVTALVKVDGLDAVYEQSLRTDTFGAFKLISNRVFPFNTELSHTKRLSVPPNVGVPVSFLVKAKKLGDMTVRVKASIMLGEEHDAIERVIRVLPESLVQPRMQTRFFCLNEYQNQSFELPLNIDKRADVGSVSIRFEVVSNILTSVVRNLGDLLSVPTGCGEQNMVRFVPNIEVLDYLTATGSKEAALIAKATGFLEQGYQNQMKYRQPDGSFGVWEGRGGSVFLTAFVVKSMKTAAKYITVDKTMNSQAFTWLATKQKLDGRFEETGPVAHKDMQGALRQGISLTSYVMIAFMENPVEAAEHPSVISNGMKYLSSNYDNINDSYDLAIATYAFWLNNHYRKTEAIAKLIKVSASLEKGKKCYWPRASNQIETTAYALLSYVMAKMYIDGTAIMRWLVDQRYSTGSFPRTQDTFVGLKALSKLAEKISPSRNDYSIQLKFANEKKEFRFTSTDLDQFSYEEIPEGVKKLTVDVGGIGVGFLQVNYQYSLNLVNFTERFNLDLVKKNSTSDYELQLYVCSSYIPNLTDERSNMALVEVNFPSGYVVDSNPISEATDANPIQKIEILHGGTSVVLYYNNMGAEKNCFVIIAYRRFKVALRRPAYVKVHDYYVPNLNAIKVYEVDKQEVCDICKGEDCPESCKNVPK
ncbi:thioester-containing protein 1 allele S3-like [Anopheles cruzii]|uniref:thioester-containing protein 1 allele S3-like n=1 Tax=Anopheles cruzii TaxID=68878 RepID=UPI0022EC4813|nr:thioester-containing protein 1 allele S3-like [Anopheles cruzii]